MSTNIRDNKDPSGQKKKEEEERNKKETQDISSDRPNTDQLTNEDLPDSSNESTGAMGSGQRQDSN